MKLYFTAVNESDSDYVETTYASKIRGAGLWVKIVQSDKWQGKMYWGFLTKEKDQQAIAKLFGWYDPSPFAYHSTEIVPEIYKPSIRKISL